MLIAALTKNHLPKFDPHNTVDEALTILEHAHMETLPLVAAQKFLGMVNEDFLLDQPNGSSTLNSFSHLLPRAVAKADQHVLDAFGRFHEFRTTLLAVEDAQDNYLGTLAINDLIWEIGSQPAMKMPGGIIVLEMPANDYHLSQLSQIFETDDAKILTLLVRDVPETFGWIDVTIKTNKTDLSRILKSLARYNYTVKSVFHMGEQELDLRQRYDALMNYLNM